MPPKDSSLFASYLPFPLHGSRLPRRCAYARIRTQMPCERQTCTAAAIGGLQI